MRDQLLHWVVVAEIAQVAEYRHETLGLERHGVDIYFGLWVGRGNDPIFLNLIREEGCNNGE